MVINPISLQVTLLYGTARYSYTRLCIILQAAARVEYCSQLGLIHFVMFGKSNNYLKNLTKACVCAQRNARSNAHPSRPNSRAVVLNMVKDWHRDMVSALPPPPHHLSFPDSIHSKIN